MAANKTGKDITQSSWDFVEEHVSEELSLLNEFQATIQTYIDERKYISPSTMTAYKESLLSLYIDAVNNYTKVVKPKINIRFSLNQKVWTIEGNKIMEFPIRKITVTLCCYQDETVEKIIYEGKLPNGGHFIGKADKLFSTKKNLLKTVRNK